MHTRRFVARWSSPILLLVGCTGDVAEVGGSTFAATETHGLETADTVDEPTAGGDSGDGGDSSGGTSEGSGDGGEDSSSTPPEPLDPPVAAVGPRTVGADAGLSCAIRTAAGPGPVACWGRYQSVVLSVPVAIGAQPETVAGLTDAVDLAVGADHVCAARAGGAVVCWGFNHHSQLGLPADAVFHPTAAAVAGVTDAVQVTVGSSHSCALLGDGGVQCWGMGGWGQLGSGDPEDLDDSAAPVHVAGVEHAVKVVGGGGHTCALLDDQRVMCWGFNPFGEVGTGTSGDSPPASVVQGVGPAIDVALNNHGTWVLGGDGTVWYLGTHNSPEKIVIPEVEQVVAGAVRIDGTNDRACVTDAFGAATCWDYRERYAWGTGEPNRARDQLIAQSEAPPLRELAVGRAHICGRADAGEVVCWGQGDSGQLGPGGPGEAEVLATPALLQGATHIASHDDGTCAAGVAGAVWCWGKNTGGRLGPGAADSVLPQAVEDLVLGDDVRDLAMGADFSCAAAGGHVTCWGSNTAGQLGAATSEATVQVPGLEQIERVVIGGEHACALQTGGAIACWGENLLGELGRGTFSAKEGPAWVSLPAAAVDVAAGEHHTCAALDNQEAWCWGLGKSGQLGSVVLPNVDQLGEDGPESYLRMYVKLAPQKLSLTDVVRVAASRDDTCVAHSTGVTCHGQSYAGATPTSAVAGGDLSATRLLLSGWGGCRLGSTGAACHGAFTALGAGESGDVLGGAVGLTLGGYACVVEAGGAVRCYSDTDLAVLAGTLESTDAAVVVPL